MLCSLACKFGSRVIYFSFKSVFLFRLDLLQICLALVRRGQAHSSCKFLRLFHLVVFLHSSSSVVVSYFMFNTVFVILLFSVTVFPLMVKPS